MLNMLEGYLRVVITGSQTQLVVTPCVRRTRTSAFENVCQKRVTSEGRPPKFSNFSISLRRFSPSLQKASKQARSSKGSCFNFLG